jgi:hypothetical protein
MISPIATLTSPRFTALVNLIGVASLLISFIFWWDSRSVADVTFYVSPIQPAVVLRGQLTGDLKLDGSPILGNVYAARLYIWNAGKKSVTATDILPTFKVSTKTQDSLDRIISARVVAVSRSEVNAKVKILAKNVIRPEWDLLEAKDGFYVQLVYVAFAPVEWQVEGAIVSQPKISTWDASITYEPSGKLSVAASWWRNVLAFVCIILAMFLVVKPLQTLVKTTAYFRKNETIGESKFKGALRFFVVDFLPVCLMGAVVVSALQFVKTWGAPPVFLF